MQIERHPGSGRAVTSGLYLRLVNEPHIKIDSGVASAWATTSQIRTSCGDRPATGGTQQSEDRQERQMTGFAEPGR